ncbi:MAG: hypothetical protein IIX55_04775 [Muribaculaceae bacterium]|jgi:hypothetical protein|nr:hypothetical protein [Muribaculaceae bacterium]
MKKSMKKYVALALCGATMVGVLGSCGSNEFKVSGKIEGADDKSIVLERGFNGRWFALDSVRTSSDGEFAMSFEAPSAPEVYRLKMDGRYVYFPIDSLEQIKVVAPVDKFDTAFELSGSDDAVALMNFEKEANALNINDSTAVATFKRKVFAEIIKDGKASLLCYHVLNKSIDGKFLFDPTDAFDLKIYAAVATAYKQFKPSDPRTALLEAVAIEGRKKLNAESGRQNVIQAEEIHAIDIALKDANGVEQKLSDMLKQGRPTVVIFSLLNEENSPVVNRQISKVYEANKGGVNFYQVCLDYDQLAWKNAAVNLPWTVVYDPAGERSQYAIKYNVQTLPAVYIYNAKGELVDQATSFSDLSSKLSRL